MSALLIRRLLAGLVLVSVSCSPVIAQETSIYEYDKLGRLKKVGRSYPGGASTVDYSHDDADNRSSVAYTKTATSCRVEPNNFDFNIGGGTGTTYPGGGVWIGLSGYCSGPVTIAYTSQDGTAVANGDYGPVSSQIVIDPATANSGYYTIGWARRAETETYYYVNFTIVSGDAVLARQQSRIGIYLD